MFLLPIAYSNKLAARFKRSALAVHLPKIRRDIATDMSLIQFGTINTYTGKRGTGSIAPLASQAHGRYSLYPSNIGTADVTTIAHIQVVQALSGNEYVCGHYATGVLVLAIQLNATGKIGVFVGANSGSNTTINTNITPVIGASYCVAHRQVNGQHSIFVNGVKTNDVSLGYNGNSGGSFTSNNINYVTASTNSSRQLVYYAGKFKNVFTDVELLELTRKPQQLFEPVQQVFYFNTASGSGSTAALTGGSILIFSSSIVSSSDKELSPSVNTIEQGVLKSLTNKPLLGDESSFFNSTLTSSINKILSGTGLVSSVGNISVFTVGDTTLPLSGSAIVSALEILISARNLSIAGAGLSSSIGTLVSDRNVTVLSSLLQSSSSTLNSLVSKSIAGLLLSSSLGTLQLDDGSVTLPLTGISGTLSQDSLLPLFTKGLSGSSLILSSEQLRALVSKVLPGQSTVIAQGDTGVVITRSLTGSVTVSGQGSVLFADSNATISLSGSSIITSQGVLAILGDIEPVITKVVVQGISYTLLTFNTLNKIIT